MKINRHLEELEELAYGDVFLRDSGRAYLIVDPYQLAFAPDADTSGVLCVDLENGMVQFFPSGEMVEPRPRAVLDI